MLLLLMLLLCTSTFLFTYTLIRSLLTTLDSHVQDFGYLLILFRCSCDRTLCEKLEFLSLLALVFLSLLSSYYSRFSMYISFGLYSSSFIWYYAWMLICDIVVIIDLLWFRFIPCSGYFRVSVYTWDISLAYIRRRPSSRLHFRVCWEAGRDTSS